MNDILELHRMWFAERVLSPEFTEAVCDWLDRSELFDPRDLLDPLDSSGEGRSCFPPDAFAMYCTAAV